MPTYQAATQCHNQCESTACLWRILLYGIRCKTQVFMAVNMKNVSSGLWHFTGINYLCHLGVRVPMKWRQKVSLKYGSFFTRLYCIASLKPILFMEFVCVCVCVCDLWWMVVWKENYATFAWGCCGCPHEAVMHCTQSAFCVVMCR